MGAEIRVEGARQRADEVAREADRAEIGGLVAANGDVRWRAPTLADQGSA
jgi:hypothetical protein